MLSIYYLHINNLFFHQKHTHVYVTTNRSTLWKHTTYTSFSACTYLQVFNPPLRFTLRFMILTHEVNSHYLITTYRISKLIIPFMS
ncbi:hypothetical protein Hanom_Chr09g00794411 [Helianthus anomalus]